MSEACKHPPLKLLAVIVDWEKAELISTHLQDYNVHLHYRCKAEGTASSEILDMLGLGSVDKAVILCLAPQSVVRRLLIEITEEFKLKAKGAGIAFSLPISGVGGYVLKILNEETKEMVIKHLEKMERQAESMKSEASHNLIVAVINQGYSEDLMEAAKAAGATGGTVVHARRVGPEESIKFLGISVQAEKEIVAILTPMDKKVEIMKSIGKKCGSASEAQGILFALPVDSVGGM